MREVNLQTDTKRLEPCEDDPRADVYYLAEKIGIHQLYALVVQLRGEPEPREDDKGCSNCMYSGRPTYKSPCSECHDNSQWEMKSFSRSHENDTECEDAVSRNEFLKRIEPYNTSCKMDKALYNFAFNKIISCSSATPKARTGKWLINSDGYYPYCSECKAEPKSGEMTDFCPNCGADMRGEQDEPDK